jgi:hypothetical protein
MAAAIEEKKREFRDQAIGKQCPAGEEMTFEEIREQWK